MAGYINSPSNLCHITRDEKAAMQGTFGSPSDTNRYVTTTDNRVAVASDTNSGIMSAADYTLLHALANTSLSGLTDLQMAMLAQTAYNLLGDETGELLALPAITQYVNVETFTDGILPSGASVNNLSRNGGALTLKPDSSTNIQLLDDCASTSSWNTYNPSSNGSGWGGSGGDGVSGFSHTVEYWDLVGQNALKQQLLNSAGINDEWYLIAANYRNHSKSNTYGFLLTTKVTADNNPITTGWAADHNKCVKQDIKDNQFYEDFWTPFPGKENVSKMIVGMYAMYPASPMIAWFSNIRAVVGAYPTMATSGQYISPTYNYSNDIADVIVVEHLDIRDHQDGTTQLDISLDGGAHWATNKAANTMINVVSDLPNADGSPWDNKQNLKLRYTINRGSLTGLGQGPELEGLASIVRTA